MICDICDRPKATQEQWDSHPSGCECAECRSVCWGNCTPKRPNEWRAERDGLRTLARELAEALAEHVKGCRRCHGRGIVKNASACETRWNDPCPDCKKDRAALAHAREMGVIDGD